ncbi:MAG TPA: hypothetical protein VFP50_07780 [Anaeromyxobacteraceae bacterium]|nr:hypothetical protein [Anaeromyxobacteraceae bacterium]
MLGAALLSLLLLAPPELRVDASVPAGAAAVLERAWADVEALARADGLEPPGAPRPIAVGTAPALPPGVAAASRPGFIGLRAGLPLAGAGATALRHEAAHQLLFEACPAAQGDRLFHEAFAIAASGELADWSRAEEGAYLPLAGALEALARAPDLDAPAARRAVARLLADAPPRAGHLPAPLALRLGGCGAGARWSPLRPEELASDRSPAADALVVLSRHSGELLVAEGAASLPMPFGSTLKPFMVAGAPGPTPRLAPDRTQPGWRCGDALPERMDAATALLRSCNGWFLDWAGATPHAARLGAWGPVLVALGLPALPADASEAIGIRPSLRLSPVALAQAYRLLAEARPDLVDVLSRNAREGTLAGLEASGALAGLAAKTGTVLDASGTPRLGWIVGVDRDVVVVMARAGRPPRTFAGAFAEAVARARVPAHQAAKVQVFGLVGAAVRGRCAGRGVALEAGGPRLLADAEAPLLELARAGPLLCAGGPWLVRLPGAEAPRAYAGIFAKDPAPALPFDPRATRRERNARRGSDLLFRTHRLAYAAGVVTAEDAASRGEARVALARVVDANAEHSRHLGRPVCDTTHCQVFLGTRAPGKEERRALAEPLRVDRWLPFARGGTEPWRAERREAEVQAALGTGARALAFGRGRVSFVTSASDGADRWEERRDLPCESLRGPLKLPSCPERVSARGGTLVFEGRGQGHGEGLDVEWAGRSGLSAEAILEAAYGGGRR